MELNDPKTRTAFQVFQYVISCEPDVDFIFREGEVVSAHQTVLRAVSPWFNVS